VNTVPSLFYQHDLELSKTTNTTQHLVSSIVLVGSKVYQTCLKHNQNTTTNNLENHRTSNIQPLQIHLDHHTKFSKLSTKTIR
jgi:hypothetical protein